MSHTGGNVLRREILEAIKAFEDELQAQPGYTHFCFQSSACTQPCHTPNTVVPLFFPNGESTTTDGYIRDKAQEIGIQGVYYYTDKTFEPLAGTADLIRSGAPPLPPESLSIALSNYNNEHDHAPEPLSSALNNNNNKRDHA
jgi:hypothetical protein